MTAPGEPTAPSAPDGQAFFAGYKASHPYGTELEPWEAVSDESQKAMNAGAEAVAAPPRAQLAALKAGVSALAAKFTTCAASDFKAATEQGGSAAHGLRGAGQAAADCAKELLELIGAPVDGLPGPKTMDGIAAMPGVVTVLSTPQCAVVRAAGEVVTVIGMTASGLRQYASEEEYGAQSAADGEPDRSQLSEARETLARWDEAGRAAAEGYGTERTLADHLRSVLAIVRRAGLEARDDA